MREAIKIFGILSIAIFLSSCEKQAGKGGTSTITGRVLVLEYNSDFTILRDTIPMQNEDVFIIYGDDEIYGDRFRTDYEGRYEFKYLQEGSYRVFTYSKDPELNYDLTDELVPVFKDVEITGKNQTIEVEDIYVLQ